jgi:hypothetical protein
VGLSHGIGVGGSSLAVVGIGGWEEDRRVGGGVCELE